MITEDNMVKVMDFGIAKVDDLRTSTIPMLWAPYAIYLQNKAKGSAADCRTDIYSLGIVMYEMVTGQVPYNAESLFPCYDAYPRTGIPPKEIISDIPENINRIILKCMQKNRLKDTQTG